MSARKSPAPAPKPATPARRMLTLNRGDTNNLKPCTGSEYDAFSQELVTQIQLALHHPSCETDERRDRKFAAALTAMQALAPADEIESMICAQAVAAHIAAMQYAGRAMNPEQPLDAIAVFQKGASASSRVFIELLGALDRKRGRGTQQSVRVEHVHIHPGAQGIVGNISTTGGGGGQEMRARLRDPGQLAHAPGACADLATLLGADQAEDLVPVPGDAERPVLPARRRQHGTENS